MAVNWTRSPAASASVRAARWRSRADLPQHRLVRRQGEELPIIYRPPVEPLARNFVYFFALAPGAGRGAAIRPVRARRHRRRRGRRAGDVGARRGGGRRDPSRCVARGCWARMWAAAVVAPAAASCSRSCSCPGPVPTRSRPRCRRARSRTSSTRALPAAPTIACARSPARDPAGKPDHAAFRPAASLHRYRPRAHAVDQSGQISETGGASWFGAPPAPPARRRPGNPEALPRHRPGGATPPSGMAGDRDASSCFSRQLGHRAAEGAVGAGRAVRNRRVGKGAKSAVPTPARAADHEAVGCARAPCPHPTSSLPRQHLGDGRADPARPAAFRTASATDRPGETSAARGWCARRSHSRTSARGCA